MQFYYELLAPAVAHLEENTSGARHVLYDRARTALLVAHLRRVNPPLDNSDIIRERLALEDAICNVEVKYRLAKLDRIQLKLPKRPGMVMRILRALALTQPAAAAARRSGRPDIERRQIHERTSPTPKRLYERSRLTVGRAGANGGNHPPSFQLGAGWDRILHHLRHLGLFVGRAVLGERHSRSCKCSAMSRCFDLRRRGRPDWHAGG
jgi:hypothetical protein